MADEVKVVFGAETADLEQGADRAADAVGSVREAGNSLSSYFNGLKEKITSALGSAVPAGDKASSAIAEVADSAKAGATGLTAMGAAGIAAGTAFLALAAAVGAIKLGMNFVAPLVAANDALDDLSQRIGMTVEETSRLNAMANMNNRSVGEFVQVQQKLGQTMTQAAAGGKQQQAVLAALGLSASGSKTPMEALMQVADKFKEMPDGPAKTSLAIKALGPAGASLIPVFNKGSDALKDQIELAEKLGLVVSGDLVEATNAINEANIETTMGIQGLKQSLAAELVPAVLVVTEGIRDFVLAMAESYRTGGTVKTIIEAIGFAFRAAAVTIRAAGMVIYQVFNFIRLQIDLTRQGLVGFAEVATGLYTGGISGAMAAAKNNAASMSATIKQAGANAAESAVNMKKFYDAIANPQARTRQDRPTSANAEVPGLDTGADAAAKRAEAAARRAALARLRVQIEEIDTKQQLAEDDLETVLALEEQKLQLIKQFYGEDSAEYQRALQAKRRIEDRWTQEKLGIERDRINQVANIRKDELETEAELNRLAVDSKMAAIDRMEAADQNAGVRAAQARAALVAEEIAMEQQSAARIYEISAQSIRDTLALQGLRKEDRQRLLDELERLEAQHENRMKIMQARANNRIEQANTQVTQAAQQKWMGVTQPIANAFNGAFQSMWTYTANFKDSMLKALDQIVMHFVQQGFQMVAQWAAMEMAKTGATAAGVATRTATETAGAATSQAINASTGLASIGVKAVEAAAGAYAAIAGIPYVGPILAPIAAAGALAAVMALGNKVMSASGGYDIPSGVNPMTQLHEKEMVLPAHIAEPLRKSLSAGGRPNLSNMAAQIGERAGAARESSSQTASEVTLNYQPSHGGSGDMKELLRRDASSLRRWLRNEARNGTISGVGKK